MNISPSFNSFSPSTKAHRVSALELEQISTRLKDRGYLFNSLEDIRGIEHEHMVYVETNKIGLLYYHVFCSKIGITPFIRIVQIKKQFFILKSNFESPDEKK